MSELIMSAEYRIDIIRLFSRNNDENALVTMVTTLRYHPRCVSIWVWCYYPTQKYPALLLRPIQKAVHILNTFYSGHGPFCTRPYETLNLKKKQQDSV